MPITMTKPALKQLKGRDNLVGAEIGVGKGTHASFYLSELDIDFVFLIDPYTAYEDCKKKFVLEETRDWKKETHVKLDKYNHKIKWIEEKTSDAVKFIADSSLDFAYIDANHTYESVAEDIRLYYPKVKKGGLLSGHDYDFEDVKKAVDKFIKKQDLKLYIKDLEPGQFSGVGMKYDWWAWKEK